MNGRKKLKKQFKFKYFFYIFIFIFIWELFGVFDYVESFKKYNNQTLDLSKTDMIVVLTGSAGRLNLAYKLFKDYSIKKLLISGVGSNITYNILAKQYNWDMLDEENILLDNLSSSTIENAKISYDKIMQHEVNNICIVTSLMHMKRAELLFDWAFKNSTVNVSYYSSSQDIFDYKFWYKDSKMFKTIFSEYFKYEYYKFLILIKSILKESFL